MTKLLEYIKLALRNIKGNLLRTILTCLIIAFGIMALVGIQTVISSLGNSVTDLFSPFGTNQFTITNRNTTFESNKTRKPNEPLRYTEAKEFKELMQFPGKITITRGAAYGLRITANGKETNPNFILTAGDENYLELHALELEHGRNFSLNELNNGENVTIIPYSLATKLFPELNSKDVIDERVTAKGQRYRIIGVLEDKGQGFGGSSNFILVPLENTNKLYGTDRSNYTIKMGVHTQEALEPAMAEAKGVMRSVRNLRTVDEDDFHIENANAANEELAAVLNNVSMGGLLIGVITLSGAAIGLMNILLVSVTERIREIGISKAIGATVHSIRLQYFLEGILISLFGGLLGIMFGLIAGWGVAKLTKSIFTVPWGWVSIGIIICLVVGLISSIYPAIKASRLNPIEALRHN